MAVITQPTTESPVAKKSTRYDSLLRILRYSIARLLTLFVTVIIGIYLTIIIANMGGYVDEIMRGEIRDRVTQAIINSPAGTSHGTRSPPAID
jgi:peptide/nickel transport system permease protein